jgi:hypothetical protein
MGGIFKFYWLWIKEAGHGSLVIANAWQGIWGILALWAFGYWRGGPVMIPDKVDEYALVFLFASLSATWLGVFLFQFSVVPAKLYWAEHARVQNLSEELKVAQKQTSADDTKWTIKDLFYHIDHDYLENKSWEKIGDNLRDALSEGRLTMWGRLKETDSGPWVGPRAALAPIEKIYWYKAYFTYFFFHEQATDGVHCYADRKTGRPAYTDLQVSRNEALAAFPGDPDDIADSYPNIRLADSPTAMDLLNGRERPKLIGLLSSGKLCAWARISASLSSDLFPMNGSIWKTHSLMFLAKGDDPKAINQTFLRPRGNQNSSHYDICLNHAQLKRVWPDLQISQSRCDVGR